MMKKAKKTVKTDVKTREKTYVDALFERTLNALNLNVHVIISSGDDACIELEEMTTRKPVDAVLGNDVDERSGFKAGDKFSIIVDKLQFLRDELPCVDFFMTCISNEDEMLSWHKKTSNVFKGCKNLEEIAVRCDLLEAGRLQ